MEALGELGVGSAEHPLATSSATSADENARSWPVSSRTMPSARSRATGNGGSVREHRSRRSPGPACLPAKPLD